MTTATISSGRADNLPKTLQTAQKAIYLPEVQAMLRRLSEYNLGICMPHRRDEHTGDFQPLPEDLTQVESSLRVSFQSTADISSQAERFMPVGWYWRAAAPTPIAVCEMVRDGIPGNAQRADKHKMLKGN